jgi:hypothetical protein
LLWSANPLRLSRIRRWSHSGQGSAWRVLSYYFRSAQTRTIFVLLLIQKASAVKPLQASINGARIAPRLLHCTGAPLGLVARGRSLYDRINSDMSTDITGQDMWTHSCGGYALVGRCGLCFGVGERQSTTACMSLSVPVGLATQCWSTATHQCT